MENETRMLKREEMTEEQKRVVDIVETLYKAGTCNLMDAYDIYKQKGIIIIAK